MKKSIALILSVSLLLSACGQSISQEIPTENEVLSLAESTAVFEMEEFEKESSQVQGDTAQTTRTLDKFQTIYPEYHNLSDQALLECVEDTVYTELVDNLDDDYFVFNVNAVYVSKEYLEEVSYNSKENIFFGYTLAELDEQFQGTRYVFSLGEEGETIVEQFEEYDDTYERAIKNVAIGAGVILICVTVSAVSGGAGAAAISMIFAVSAKTGTIMALSSGGIGALASGIVTGIQTKDFDKALKAAALAGSEGFKWGAISGVINGGISEAIALKGATLNGLTINQAATIQKESGYPLDIIKQMHSMDEYQIYKDAKLVPRLVNGKLSLVRDIDLDYESTFKGKVVTNLERMQEGLAPIDPVTGEPYQLHHMYQNADGTLAILTRQEHLGNSSILNVGGRKEITDAAWNKQRKEFWKAFAKAVGGT